MRVSGAFGKTTAFLSCNQAIFFASLFIHGTGRLSEEFFFFFFRRHLTRGCVCHVFGSLEINVGFVTFLGAL
jgi:hypothetical protein